MPILAKPPRKPVQRRTTQTVSIPAPILGMNSTDSPYDLDPRNALGLTGFVADGDGTKVRTGTKYHIDAPFAPGVRSLFAFHGATSTDDRLFAATTTGICNVTVAAAALPVVSQAFAVTTGNAGYCSSVTLVPNGGPMLLVCDEVNGYYYYNPSGAAWTKAVSGAGAGQINGVDPALLTFVTVWKNRVWFVQGGTGRAWYLPVGQYAGTVSAFDFGHKFPSGGSLVGLFNWTHDGGAGVDDHLVAVSSSGDIVIYAGTDPSTAGAFEIVGSYSAGGMATTRRYACDVGGDLWLNTKSGLFPISAIRNGGMDNPRASVSYPIAGALRDAPGLVHPIVEDAAILVGSYMVSRNTRSWSLHGKWNYLSTTAAATFRGQTFVASDSAIFATTGTKDNVARDGTGGNAIGCEFVPKRLRGVEWRTWTQLRVIGSGLTFFEGSVGSTLPAVTETVGGNGGVDGQWCGLSLCSRDIAVDLSFTSDSGGRLYGLDLQFIPGGVS